MENYKNLNIIIDKKNKLYYNSILPSNNLVSGIDFSYYGFDSLNTQPIKIGKDVLDFNMSVTGIIIDLINNYNFPKEKT